MTIAPPDTDSLLRHTGWTYFPIAFIARLPFAMIVVGVLTLVVSARGSIALGGLTSAAVGIGAAVFGPLLGAASDRFGQRAVLVPVGLLNAALLAAYPFVVSGPMSDGMILAFSCCIGATAPQVAPMSRTRLVAIITHRFSTEKRDRALDSTMAYESAADETGFIFGPFLVGVLASAIAPWLPIATAATLTLVFVTAFALHPTGRLTTDRASRLEQAPAHELTNPRLLVVVVGMLGVGSFYGATLTSLTAFMETRNNADGAGLLYGFMGITAAGVALASALIPRRISLGRRWLGFAAILLAGSIAYASSTSVLFLSLMLAVVGIGIGPTQLTLFSLGSERSPLGRLGTTMTMLGSSVIVGQSLAAALTGMVSERYGATSALSMPVVAATLVLLAAMMNLVLSRPRMIRTD